MMMAKREQEEESPPAFATPAPQLSSVQDLERRLQLIGNSPDPAVAQQKPAPVPGPAAPAPAAQAPVKAGKTALLARIMAAKEKTQQAQVKHTPPKEEPVDLLGDFDAPSSLNEPPPAYDTNFLPPPPPTAADTNLMDFMQPPPPAFDATLQFAPPPPLNNSVLPPPMETMAPPTYSLAPPEASAPSFEDLLPPPANDTNLLDMPTPLAPPPPPEIDEDILAALDPAEREAILEEQRKIMEQIEKEKSQNNNPAARAKAFDQRSSAAVAKVAGQYDTRGPVTSSSRAKSSSSATKKAPPSYSTTTSGARTIDLGAGEQAPLYGQEKTQKAIQDGTALIVQCLNCQNWMQVTKDATLMFCPTCQVVSPVLADEAATDADLEAAAQLAADAQLAEKLQAEEYGQAQAASSSSKKKATAQKKTAKLEKGTAMEQSWYDWFMGSSTTAEPAKPPPTRGSAELPSRGGGLVAASTGQESYGQYGSSGGGGARMAESKGMFACVADAVGTAVYSMSQDEEGNVHGVDASGLLAMPNVSRQRD